MTDDSTPHLRLDFIDGTLERIDGKIDKLDDRLRALEASVVTWPAVFTISGLFAAIGGVAASLWNGGKP